MEAFERLESKVRMYSRHFPEVFQSALGSFMYTSDGRGFIDFLSGASALNYGHNHPALLGPLARYLEGQGIMHSLDLATSAKADFMKTFERIILRARCLSYLMQFTGPTGTDAVEAALKLARKYTKRRRVLAFRRSYHGVSLGSLSATWNPRLRACSGVELNDVGFLPYCSEVDDQGIGLLQESIESEVEEHGPPAAVILEAVQGEGGVHCCTFEWLRAVEHQCRSHGALLIVDEIQAGCGRCGGFFSFEGASVTPDIVALSKSISGSGLPMAMLLIRPEVDCWDPGDHTGTFRGNNLAFVTATAALKEFWVDEKLSSRVRAAGETVKEKLTEFQRVHTWAQLTVRGRGLIWGLASPVPGLPGTLSRKAFARRLIVETCGDGQTLKLLPSLLVEPDVLNDGLRVVEEALSDCAYEN